MKIEPLGDAALQVVLGEHPDAGTAARVHAAVARLRQASPPGMLDCVPGFTTVTLHLDPLAMHAGFDAYAEHLERLLADVALPVSPPAGRLVEIPVHYGGEHGPDLGMVCDLSRLSLDEVVEAHSAAEYRVQMVGFIPGFPYLAGLDERLSTPRRTAPRTRVPAGSVGIGGCQTGVYPVNSPGGWQLIGWTPLRLFDPGREPAALLAPGDRVRFRPVGERP